MHSLKSPCFMDSTVFFYVILFSKGFRLALPGIYHACCAIDVLHNTKNCMVVKFCHNEVLIKYFL